MQTTLGEKLAPPTASARQFVMLWAGQGNPIHASVHMSPVGHWVLPGAEPERGPGHYFIGPQSGNEH